MKKADLDNTQFLGFFDFLGWVGLPPDLVPSSSSTSMVFVNKFNDDILVTLRTHVLFVGVGSAR